MTDAPCPALSRPSHLARAANRVRQQLRPKEPTSLEFDLEEDHIPDDFLRADVHVRDRQHLIFATEQQLHHLSKAKTWYVDGTFKLCRHPFTQLLSINAFIRYEDYVKQVPLLFVLMSGRKKSDYKQVNTSNSTLLILKILQKSLLFSYIKLSTCPDKTLHEFSRSMLQIAVILF